MKTILVATDFSPAALNAAEYATDMALAINADVYLLHVSILPFNYSEIPVVMDVDEMIDSAEKEISEIKTQLWQKANGKLNIKTEVRLGTFFRDLQAVCGKIQPYAVVIGSQRKTATERNLFGEHAVFAMKNLPWPLITIPRDAKFSSIKKIGLACDFREDLDTPLVNEIKILVNDFHAELHIVSTNKKEEYKPDLAFKAVLLEEKLSPIKPTQHFITCENTDDGIMDFAERNHIDLLVALPKRYNLINKLIHRSHTKQFVLHSHVPVMALHQ